MPRRSRAFALIEGHPPVEIVYRIRVTKTIWRTGRNECGYTNRYLFYSSLWPWLLVRLRRNLNSPVSPAATLKASTALLSEFLSRITHHTIHGCKHQCN